MRRLIYGFLVVLLIAGPVLAEVPSHLSQLQVRGEALLQVPADEVRLSVAVSTSGPQADAALAENSRSLRQVEQALLEAGLQRGEYRTGRFSLQPVWSPRPRAAAADWKPEIVGYTVSNNLQLRSRQLDKVGQWIEVAGRAGANEIGQVVFALANPRQHREAAIRQATLHAEADARAVAAAAGVKLVRILQIQLDPAGQAPLLHRGDGMLRTMAAEMAPPIVVPDDLEVRAGVAITWEISD